jgi:radical SAM protein with 4Fe4S-binding SPASM domain
MNLFLRMLSSAALKSRARYQVQQLARRWVLGQPGVVRTYRHFVDRETQAFERGGAPPPRVVYAESTNACNGHCVICPRGEMTRPVTTMPVDRFRRIADECAQWGVPEVRLHNFGEPMLDRNLVEKVAYLHARGIRSTMYSNGSLLDEHFGLALMEAGLDHLYVSFDGADKATFESVRKGLDFDRICANVRAFSALKKRTRHKNPAIYLSFTSVGQSRAAIRNVIRSWEPHVDRVFIIDPHNWGGNVSTRRQSLADGPAWPCVYLWQSMVVLASGEVSLCCIDFNGEHTVGNTDRQSLREIWTSEAMVRVRDAHRRHAWGEIPVCATCNANRMWSVYVR